MPAISAIIGAIGLATSGASAIGGLIGSSKASQAQGQAASAEEQIAQQQQQQLNLDAARQRRNIARQAIIARSTALSNATSQGAGFGASSGVQGGMAQATSAELMGNLTSNQNLGIGNQIFGLQNQVYTAQSRASTDMGEASLFNSVGSFGAMLTNNATQLGKVGSYAYNQMGWGS